MLTTAFSCGRCGTRVEAAVSSSVLHCPVCSCLLDEQICDTADDLSGGDEALVQTWEVRAEIDALKLHQELLRIDQEWEREVQSRLYRPSRGPDRVPSQKLAMVKGVASAVLLTTSVYFLLQGQQWLALLLFVNAGLWTWRAGSEYAMAEDRELTKLSYEARREDLLLQLSDAGRHGVLPDGARHE